ncbi:MAG: Ig-like domain-containing protein [Clostridia bacterium]|nr:Ig-like domain-containing protein [Clostridia bacterium]
MTKRQRIKRQRLIKQMAIVAVIFLITAIMLMILSLKSCSSGDFDMAESTPSLESVSDASKFNSGEDVSNALPLRISVERISLNANTVTISVGEKNSPVATVYPENATDKSLIWTSSDVSVATVDSNGNISAVAEGSCVVTAYSNDNKNISAQINVTVTAKVEEKILI